MDGPSLYVHDGGPYGFHDGYSTSSQKSFDSEKSYYIQDGGGKQIRKTPRGRLVIVAVDFLSKGPTDISLESQDLIQFALSQIMQNRDTLCVIAVDTKRAGCTNDSYTASMTNDLLRVMQNWKDDINQKKIKLDCKAVVASKWESGVEKECFSSMADILIIGTKHLTSVVSIKVKKVPSHFLKALPSCCEIIVVRNSTCVFAGAGVNGMNYTRNTDTPKRSSNQQLFPEPSSTENPPLTSPSSPGATSLMHFGGGICEYTYAEVMAATDNFRATSLIGEGGSGLVYSGNLRGQLMAIKRLKTLPGWFSHGNDKEVREKFAREMRVMGGLCHRNLMTVKGFCAERGVYVLAYELMPNGSLDKRLRDPNFPILTWKQRLGIAVQTASALHYIHSEAREPLIHRDVKAANILLDAHLNAYLSDFDLAKTIQRGEEGQAVCATQIYGTMGYLDPDYHSTGHVSQKSDVYSFGIVLWELLSGLLPFDSTRSVAFLGPYVEKVLEEGGGWRALVDPRLTEPIDEIQMERFVQIATLCSSASSSDRLDMSDVVEFLSNTIKTRRRLE